MGRSVHSGPVAGARTEVSQALEAIAQEVVAKHACDRVLLGDYLASLLAVAAAARRYSAAEKDTCRRVGAQAAQTGVALPALVDLYMTASRRLWPRLPELIGAVRGEPVRPADLMALGQAVWRAADDALAAMAAGYVDAQRLVVRREETLRLKFVDDLLGGSADVGSLVRRAESYGLSLAATHVVAVARTDRPVDVASRAIDWVEQAARARFSGRGALATVKDGCLVCVLGSGPGGPDGQHAAAQQLAELALAAATDLAPEPTWRVGVSRPHAGPLGVGRGHREALEAVHVADRLGLPDPVVHARQLLVYRVLLRDETAMHDLVDVVLGPLLTARDGPERLLQTLEAYFAAGGNTAAAARRLHLSVRAMTYRLRRVAELTGYVAKDPRHQLVLHVAVSGARLLNWPQKPLAGG